ncbi:hypothetical protein [uncultured Reyranella sp.]|nr:hypothetical protein [uncultured Reyranella sp.]
MSRRHLPNGAIAATALTSPNPRSFGRGARRIPAYADMPQS